MTNQVDYDSLRQEVLNVLENSEEIKAIYDSFSNLEVLQTKFVSGDVKNVTDLVTYLTDYMETDDYKAKKVMEKLKVFENLYKGKVEKKVPMSSFAYRKLSIEDKLLFIHLCVGIKYANHIKHLKSINDGKLNLADLIYVNLVKFINETLISYHIRKNKSLLKLYTIFEETVDFKLEDSIANRNIAMFTSIYFADRNIESTCVLINFAVLDVVDIPNEQIKIFLDSLNSHSGVMY